MKSPLIDKNESTFWLFSDVSGKVLEVWVETNFKNNLPLDNSFINIRTIKSGHF